MTAWTVVLILVVVSCVTLSGAPAETAGIGLSHSPLRSLGSATRGFELGSAPARLHYFPLEQPPSPLFEVLKQLIVGSNPQTPAYDPVNGYIYVSSTILQNSSGGNGSSGPTVEVGLVSVIDGNSTVGSVKVGPNPATPTVDPENGYVYVVGNSTNLSVISGSALLATLPSHLCSGGGAYDPADGYVYVESCSSGVIVLNDTAEVTTISLPYGTCPDGIGYDPALGDIYVTDMCGNTLQLLNGTSDVGAVEVDGAPFPGAYDSADGVLYIPCEGLGGAVDLLKGTDVTARVSIGLNPISATYDSANGLVYVPDQGNNQTAGWANLSVMDGSSLLKNVYIGGSPTSSAAVSVQFSNGTGYIFATNSGPLVAVAGTAIVASLDLGAWGVSGVVFDPQNQYLYVTSAAGYSTSNLSIVACTGCLGITLNETGSPMGSSWSVKASTPSTRFAVAAAAAAASPITLHLAAGSYALQLSAAPGVTVHVLSGDAVLVDGGSELYVDSTPPPAAGPAAGPGGLLPWPVATGAVGIAAAAALGVVVVSRGRRRASGRLVENVQKAIAEDPDSLRRLLR